MKWVGEGLPGRTSHGTSCRSSVLVSLLFSSTQPLFKPRAAFTLSYSIFPLIGGSLALEPEYLLCFGLGMRQNGHSILTEVRSQRPKPDLIAASTLTVQPPQGLPLFPRPCGNLPLVREKVPRMNEMGSRLPLCFFLGPNWLFVLFNLCVSGMVCWCD